MPHSDVAQSSKAGPLAPVLSQALIQLSPRRHCRRARSVPKMIYHQQRWLLCVNFTLAVTILIVQSFKPFPRRLGQPLVRTVVWRAPGSPKSHPPCQSRRPTVPCRQRHSRPHPALPYIILPLTLFIYKWIVLLEVMLPNGHPPAQERWGHQPANDVFSLTRDFSRKIPIGTPSFDRFGPWFHFCWLLRRLAGSVIYNIACHGPSPRLSSDLAGAVPQPLSLPHSL